MMSTRKKPEPHVAVIGAGFSGLRCADVLIRSGVRVTMYEARNRVGGRVHQVMDKTRPVDMGANWIHGAPGNPIEKLSIKVNSTLADPPERSWIIDQNGHRVPSKVASELVEEVWRIIVQAIEYSKEDHSKIDPKLSLFDLLKEEVPKKYPHDPIKVQNILETSYFWSFYIGDSIEKQSLRCMALEDCLDGENRFVASTYKAILDEVKNTAVESAEIRFNTEVVKIEYREPGDLNADVYVTTEDGKRDAFDEVVVTCPLGWLKRNKKTAFAPSLPEHLCAAIDNISYGNLEKLYVSFPAAFWMEDYEPPSSLSSETSTPQSSSLSSSIATSGSAQSPSPTSGEQDQRQEQEQDSSIPLSTIFFHPNYHPNPASKSSVTTQKWNQDIFSLSHLPTPHNLPSLLCYLYGSSGSYLTSSVKSHAEHSDPYNKILLNFVRPFLSRLPNYAPDTNPDCIPQFLHVTQWANDPHSGYGSYSNFQTGLIEGENDIENMRRAGGLSETGRGLWLAGEHTGPFNAMGTTNGAYWSGEFVATEIVKMYRGAEEVETGDEERTFV